MNELTDEKRNKLKIAFILFILAFLVIYGIVMVLKYKTTTKENTQAKTSNQVVFEQPTLKFFNYKVELNTYPDRITIHYPYLVVVRPDELRSEIYNMDTKRKEKEIKEVVLDYFKGDVVYNKQGYRTQFNNKDLGLLCDQAFIKSKTEIFCITRPDQNKQTNKLIVINPQMLTQKDVYTSQNVITALYYDKSTLYIGEFDFTHNKSYITVKNNTFQTSDLVNMFYPMENAMYTASFKSKRNNMTESYSKILNDKEVIQSIVIGKGELILF